MSLCFRTWYGECVNPEKKQDKFYSILAASNDEGLNWRVIAISGKNGLPGIPQQNRYHSNKNLQRFIDSKIKGGYKKLGGSSMGEEIEPNELRDEIDQFGMKLSETTKKEKWGSRYAEWLKFEVDDHETWTQPTTRKADPIKQPVNYEKDYNGQWGAFA